MIRCYVKLFDNPDPAKAHPITCGINVYSQYDPEKLKKDIDATKTIAVPNVEIYLKI
jgi:hypothetical protein